MPKRYEARRGRSFPEAAGTESRCAGVPNTGAFLYRRPPTDPSAVRSDQRVSFLAPLSSV